MTAISINHVSIHAENLEKSAAFYEQLFGMESTGPTRARSTRASART
jgi:predicted enzyme related to lactoylglutathione lyase